MSDELKPVKWTGLSESSKARFAEQMYCYGFSNDEIIYTFIANIESCLQELNASAFNQATHRDLLTKETK